MMVSKIQTLRKSLYFGLALVMIIKSSWRGGGTLIIIGWILVSEPGFFESLEAYGKKFEFIYNLKPGNNVV